MTCKGSSEHGERNWPHHADIRSSYRNADKGEYFLAYHTANEMNLAAPVDRKSKFSPFTIVESKTNENCIADKVIIIIIIIMMIIK